MTKGQKWAVLCFAVISIAGEKPLSGTFTLVDRSPLHILVPLPVESAKLENCFFQLYEDDSGYEP